MSGLYYGVTISLVSFATGLSVVTLNLHHRGMRGQRWENYRDLTLTLNIQSSGLTEVFGV